MGHTWKCKTTHRMINFVVAKGSRRRRSGAVRFHTLSLPQKLARALSRPGVEATAILATKHNVVTWQRKLWLLTIQTLNCFNEQNIGSCDKKWWHHAIIGIRHNCVCIVGVKLPRVLPRLGGETTPLGVWHQHYTHNHVWCPKQNL